jgi:LytS/YehU family sensor histidine kinase
LEKFCHNNSFVEFLIDKKYRLYRHLAIWLYIFVLSYDPNEPKEYSGNFHFYNKIIWGLFFLTMVYINMYVLVPRLLFKDKYFPYLFCLITIIVCGYLVVREVHILYFDRYRIGSRKVFSSLFRETFAATNLLTITVFSSTSIKLFQRWSRDSIRLSELEKSSLQIELRELKNQINPHFLFNMLNSVNVLVKKDQEKASIVIMKLSGFLRYQLYENNSQSVFLKSEIKFLNDFIELEKIRRDDFSFTLSARNKLGDGTANTEQLLPPNLFIIFVENALKHSVDPEAPSKVDITFTIGAERMEFKCSNTKPKEPVLRIENGGLGLANITRRLELLYGDKYTLIIQDYKESYTVTLNIPL